MLRLFILLSVLILPSCLFSQDISYAIPEGYEKLVSPDEYKEIVDLSVARIRKRYAVDMVRGGTILLKKNHSLEVFYLHNLITRCAAVPDHGQRKQLINAHFDLLFSAAEKEGKVNLEDFESIQPYLSLRIYPKEVVAQRGGAGNLLARQDLEGTFTLLMFAFPGSFIPVQRSVFNQWGKTEKEVFALAQSHVNRHPVITATRMIDVDTIHFDVTLLESDDYAASYLLDLSLTMPQLVGEWGSVVSVPNKGLVTICRVSRENPASFIRFIEMHKLVNDQYFAQHPQPVSRNYYWYYNGKFTRIGVQHNEKGNIQVTVPEALAALMGRGVVE